MMTEMQLQYSQLFEDKRHNRALEGISQGELDERVRHQTASENISREQMQNDKNIAAMRIQSDQAIANAKNATDKILQRMRNEISEKQLAQTEKQINAAVEEANARIKKASADTSLTEAQTKKVIQDTQGDLKTKLSSLIGDKIDVTSEWFNDKSNRQTLKKGLTTPLYKNLIDLWNVEKAKKQKQDAATRGSHAGAANKR